VAHYIIHPLFFFCFGLGLFFRNGNLSNIYIAFLGGLSFSLINIIPDIYDLTLGGKNKRSDNNSKQQDTNSTFLKKAFSSLHSICTFPVIMDAFTLFALFDLLFGKNIITFLLWFYAISMFLVWTLKLSYIVLTGKIDKAFNGVSK
jgi:hypothetical protein